MTSLLNLIIEKDNCDEFPQQGDPKMFYLDRSDRHLYRWCGDKYVAISYEVQEEISDEDLKKIADLFGYPIENIDRLRRAFGNREVINAYTNLRTLLGMFVLQENPDIWSNRLRPDLTSSSDE